MNLFFSSEWRQRLLAFDGEGSFEPERHRVALAEGATSLLQGAMRADFRSYMVDDILVKVDRALGVLSLQRLVDKRIESNAESGAWLEASRAVAAKTI